jgi:hypothetical protein
LKDGIDPTSSVRRPADRIEAGFSSVCENHRRLCHADDNADFLPLAGNSGGKPSNRARTASVSAT